MLITNYKLIDFMNQPPELIGQYLVVMKYIRPQATKCRILNMKLKHVEMIKQGINSGDDLDLIRMVSKIQGIKKKAVLELPIIYFFGLIASIKEQVSLIIKAEENGLTPCYTDLKWEAVNGSERMSRFGIYNTLESLSGGDALKYKKYMNMDYSEIFTILLMRKTASELKYEMSQIKTKGE